VNSNDKLGNEWSLTVSSRSSESTLRVRKWLTANRSKRKSENVNNSCCVGGSRMVQVGRQYLSPNLVVTSSSSIILLLSSSSSSRVTGFLSSLVLLLLSQW
jgi:hypothetical protein